MFKQLVSMFSLLALIGSLYACSKDNLQRTQSNIERNVVKDTWRVTKFIDSGTDELYHFNGYSFTFSDDGSVTATNGTNSYTGTWSVTQSSSNTDDDNRSSDDGLDDLDFNLAFSGNDDFQDLNDDWDIISQSNTRIELMDVSGGNGDVDYLTFEKE